MKPLTGKRCKSLVRAALLSSVALLGQAIPVDARLTIDRVWRDGDLGYALVTYTNDSGRTLKSAVTVECTALGDGNRKLNTNQRSFFKFERGEMPPGFSATLKIPVQLYGAEMKSMSCDVIREN